MPVCKYCGLGGLTWRQHPETDDWQLYDGGERHLCKSKSKSQSGRTGPVVDTLRNMTHTELVAVITAAARLLADRIDDGQRSDRPSDPGALGTGPKQGRVPDDPGMDTARARLQAQREALRQKLAATGGLPGGSRDGRQREVDQTAGGVDQTSGWAGGESQSGADPDAAADDGIDSLPF